jgi:molybdate transport system substrate-binding protein
MTFRTLPFLRRTACVGAALALTVAAPSAFAADLVVSAAASLTNAFKTLAEQYEHAHPDTKVVLNFGASDVLMQQIVKARRPMCSRPPTRPPWTRPRPRRSCKRPAARTFAANQVVLIVPQDSKLGIGSLKDLTRADVKRVAYGNPSSVPVGRYTKGALEAEGLWDAVAAKGVPAAERAPEPRLRGTRRSRRRLRVRHRRRDHAGQGQGGGARADRTPVTYPIAVTTQTKQAQQANSFVQYVLSAEGQAVLAKFGFQKP